MTGVQTCALRSEEHTSELQSHDNLVCRLLLETTSTAGRRRHDTPSGTGGQRRTASRAAPREGRTGCRWRASVRGWQSTPPPCFFFNDTATTEIYTLSLHDVLPI